MIELRKEFDKRGTHYQQVYADSQLFIYRLSSPGVDDGKESLWYEVFRRLVKPSDDYHADEYEKYPYDEAFGVWAWSCSNLDVVRKVLSHPERGHFNLSKEDTERIIAKINVKINIQL